jgi:hypothetical protein
METLENPAPSESPSLPTQQPLFFPVSLLKLLVMSTVTFGLYELFWFYKNWKFIQARNPWRRVMPLWRVFWGFFYCYSCFKEIREESKTRGVSLSLPAGLLATIWIVLQLAWKFPGPLCMLGWLTPLALIPLQLAVNKLNRLVAPQHNANSRFSAWNIVGIVFGGIMIIIMIIGLFSPFPQ